MNTPIPAVRLTADEIARITAFWWHATPVSRNFAALDLDEQEIYARLVANAVVDIPRLLAHINALDSQREEAV